MAVIKFGFAVLFVAYPVLVYFGLAYFDARMVALILVLVAAARLALVKQLSSRAALGAQVNIALGAAAVIGFLVMVSNSPIYLRYYPVFMNGMMLVLFFGSLLRPPTIIERFARLQTPDLSEAAISYTRKVTWVWCGFFVLNGSMALYTSLGDRLVVWTLYNGPIAYTLMGVLFAGEYLVRRRVMSDERKGS